MVAIKRVSDHPSSSNDILADAEPVPLEVLESGGSKSVDVDDHATAQEESRRSEDSLDLSEITVDHGLLGGRSNRHPYAAEHTQTSSGRFGWIGTFLGGPDPPRKHRIKPFFESFQTASIRTIKRLFPTLKSQVIALLVFHALWALVFLTILHWSVVGPEIPGYGMANRLSCGSRLWYALGPMAASYSSETDEEI